MTSTMALLEIAGKKQPAPQTDTCCGAKPSPANPAPLFQHLQRAIGNHATGRLLQAKLNVNAPADAFEQEADRVADQVLRMSDNTVPDPVPVNVPQISNLDRKCATCEDEIDRQPIPGEQREEDEEETIQTASETGQHAEITPGTQAQINSLRGGGRPLPESIRSFFEPRFGYDFSAVRVHSDAAAAETARGVNALAYTIGTDVMFGETQYSPESQAGRRLLAHELTHVVQQSAGRAAGVQRAEVRVGNLTITVEYGGLSGIAIASRAAEIQSMITTWTGAAASAATQSAVAALSADGQRWLMYGMRLHIQNTRPEHSALNRGVAVSRLLAQAASPINQPLPDTGNLFVREALRVSGWFETALTAGLSAPTGSTLSDIDVIVNPPPTSGSASDPLDSPALTSRLVPALTHLLNALDPANWPSVGTRSISAFQTIGDAILPEARIFFSPEADTAINNIYDLTPRWHASANIFNVTAMSPTQDNRIGYLRNRAEIVGRNADAADPLFSDTNIFADVHFDPTRAPDRAALAGIVSTMETDPVIQPMVDRLIQHTGRKENQGPSTRIGLVTEFNAASLTPCVDHWRGIDTLCHEVLHALVHADFVAAASRVRFPQVLREGFTEVLGVQMFNNHIRPKAGANAAFKASLEAGVTGAPCPAPAAATIGYQEAGSGAEEIRQKVGDRNFRAAYFLGRPDLAGI